MRRIRRLRCLALATWLLPRSAFGEPPPPIAPPRQIDAPELGYPRDAHGDAVVIVEIVIAEDGTVSDARVREGTEPFAELARLAALAYRFAPATRNGIPVRSRVLLRIEYRQPPPAQEPTAPATPERAVRSEPSVPQPRPPQPAPERTPVEILVVGEEREELGSIHLPKSEARLIPGAFADPFRVVEVLPGVAPVVSGLPYFHVRGAPPGDVGYFVDGVRVPVLFHVGAGPSIVAPAMVERVDLFPAAYPVRFGRYVGGIMAGDIDDPSSRPRGEAQARIFDAAAMIEQPFAEGRGAFLAAGRYSYTQALLAAVAPDYSLAYGDYQTRLSYSLNASNRVSVFAFGAFDELRNETEARTLFDVEFHRIDARWDRRTEAVSSRLALTLSADRVANAEEDPEVPTSSRESRGARLRFELESHGSDVARMRAGADVGIERFEAETEDVQGSSRAFPARADLTGGAYADVILRPVRGVEIVPGARLDLHRSRNEDFAFFEPRLTSRVRIAHGVAWVSAFALAHQLPANSGRVPGGGPSLLELDEQEAWQASEGIQVALPFSMAAKATAFHSMIYSEEAGVSARNYGMELFLRRDFTERLGGLVSYTLSRTQRTVGRDSFRSGYDRTHVLSAVLGYDLGAGFRLGSRAYFASGRPYAAVCPTRDCAAGPPNTGAIFVRRGRVPDFFRLDVRFEKRWTFASGAWVAGTLEWFNALLAREVSSVYWEPARGLVRDTEGVLTLPSIGIEAGY